MKKDTVLNRIFDKLNRTHKLNWMPDKLFLRIKYYCVFKKFLSFKNPITYNEKIQWLKVYDKNPLYTILADKYEVRKYVKDKIGGQYLVPNLGVWDKFEDIDFNSLPNEFILKATHDCGVIAICRNKADLNLDELKKITENKLNYNYYYLAREWCYKDIQPRIIAEQLLHDENGIKDYKFFCFNGKPEFMFIASDREKHETKFDFFDMDFNRLQLKQYYPNSAYNIEKPENFTLMKELASILSEGLPQARVDFYNINGKVYFGEITFYHFSGFKKFEPAIWDKIFGDYLFCQNYKIQGKV